MSTALGVPVSFFFEGLARSERSGTAEAQRLILSYWKIDKTGVRKHVRDLIQSLSDGRRGQKRVPDRRSLLSLRHRQSCREEAKGRRDAPAQVRDGSMGGDGLLGRPDGSRPARAGEIRYVVLANALFDAPLARSVTEITARE